MEDVGGDGEVAPRGELPPSISVWNHPREDLEGGTEVGAGEAPPAAVAAREEDGFDELGRSRRRTTATTTAAAMDGGEGRRGEGMRGSTGLIVQQFLVLGIVTRSEGGKMCIGMMISKQFIVDKGVSTI